MKLAAMVSVSGFSGGASMYVDDLWAGGTLGALAAFGLVLAVISRRTPGRMA